MLFQSQGLLQGALPEAKIAAEWLPDFGGKRSAPTIADSASRGDGQGQAFDGADRYLGAGGYR